MIDSEVLGEAEAARNFAHGRIGRGGGEGGRSATAYSSISKKYKAVDMQMRCFGCMDDRLLQLLLRFPAWTRVTRNSRAKGVTFKSRNLRKLRDTLFPDHLRDKYA